MRAAGLALLAAAGCNQIFGIGKTQPWDAHGPLDAPDWASAITWQTLAAIGAAPTLDPIDGLTVQVGSLDTGIASDDAMVTVPLTSVPVAADGTFAVPYALGLGAYRVAFTAPDGIPTEIQTTLRGFHYAIPLYGRHDRDGVPANATFSATATGETGTYANERLLTAGLWSVTDQTSAPAAGTIAMPYQTQSMSLSGPLGVPHTAAGDVEVVLFMSGLNADTGFAVFTADGLGPAGAATWQNPAATSILWNGAMIANAMTRLEDSLGSLAGTSPTPKQDRWAGVVPTTAMPSFVQPGATGVAPPVLLPLAESGALLTFQNPFTGATGAPQLPTAIYAGDYLTRTVDDLGGTPLVKLASGLQAVMLADGSSSNPVAFDYTIGIAASSGATPATLAGVALAGEYTQVALGGAAMVPLTFGADGKVDDCAVTLYRVEAPSMPPALGTLTPLARYIVTDTPAHAQFPILVDAAYFDASSLFTFGIHCELGHDAHDFTRVIYPFESSTTFTATFKTS